MAEQSGSNERLPAELVDALRQGPFHLALSTAVRYRGLPLAAVRERLVEHGCGVAQSTLSYWQRGIRRPEATSGTATVIALEQILGLPPNSLVSLLNGENPRGRATAAGYALAELNAYWSPLEPMLEGLAESDRYHVNSGLDVLMILDDLDVDSTGMLTVMRQEVAVRARADGVAKYVVSWAGDEHSDMDDVHVQVVSEHRLGTVLRDVDHALMTYEVLFDPPLRQGEQAVFATEVQMLADARPGYLRTLRAPTSALRLRIRFAGTPPRCRKVLRANEKAEPSIEEPVAVTGQGYATAFFHQVGPGVAGILVDWD